MLHSYIIYTGVEQALSGAIVKPTVLKIRPWGLNSKLISWNTKKSMLTLRFNVKLKKNWNNVRMKGFQLLSIKYHLKFLNVQPMTFSVIKVVKISDVINAFYEVVKDNGGS